MQETKLSENDMEWGEACPLGIIMLDAQGTILWANNKIAQLSNIDQAELIGKSHENTTNQTVLHLLQEQDSICIPQTDGSLRYLHPLRKTVSHHEGSQISVLFFEDTSEIALLRHQVNTLLEKVEELQLNDELTGLPNKKAFTHALLSQVSRTRRYGNPLSLLTLDIRQQDVSHVADVNIVETAYCLRDRLRWVDTIGHVEHGIFMMLLPETSNADAIALIDKIEQGLAETQADCNHIKYHIGVASWEQGQDAHQLIAAARENNRLLEPTKQP